MSRELFPAKYAANLVSAGRASIVAQIIEETAREGGYEIPLKLTPNEVQQLISLGYQLTDELDGYHRVSWAHCKEPGDDE